MVQYGSMLPVVSSLAHPVSCLRMTKLMIGITFSQRTNLHFKKWYQRRNWSRSPVQPSTLEFSSNGARCEENEWHAKSAVGRAILYRLYIYWVIYVHLFCKLLYCPHKLITYILSTKKYHFLCTMRLLRTIKHSKPNCPTGGRINKMGATKPGDGQVST